jgi:hypothetical protein
MKCLSVFFVNKKSIILYHPKEEEEVQPMHLFVFLFYICAVDRGDRDK